MRWVKDSSSGTGHTTAPGCRTGVAACFWRRERSPACLLVGAASPSTSLSPVVRCVAVFVAALAPPCVGGRGCEQQRPGPPRRVHPVTGGLGRVWQRHGLSHRGRPDGAQRWYERAHPASRRTVVSSCACDNAVFDQLEACLELAKSLRWQLDRSAGGRNGAVHPYWGALADDICIGGQGGRDVEVGVGGV
jgi:hypothetical protein